MNTPTHKLPGHGSGSGWTSCVLYICLIICAGCNPREPGCLDIDAQNFDFQAEKHDQESCVYPDLLLDVKYKWGDLSFAPGDVYKNDLGQFFTIEEFYILFSQFILIYDQDLRSTVENKMDWYLNDGVCRLTEVPDDFVLVDRSSFFFKLGEIRKSGLQDRLLFTLGVSDTLTPACVDSLPESHLLRSERVQYDQALGDFATARFVINRDTISNVLDTMIIFSGPKLFDYVLDREFVQGRNDSVRIALDLKVLFQSLDMASPIHEIVNDLADGIELAISNNN